MPAYINPLIARDIIDMTDRMYGTFAIITGVMLELNSGSEGTSVTFQVANSMPGGIRTWAIPIIVFGIAMLFGAVTGKRRFLFWGSFCCGVWSLLFAIAFLLSAVQHEGAGALNALTWAMFAALFSVHAVGRSKRFEDTARSS